MMRLGRLMRHGRGLAHWPIAFPSTAADVAVHLRNRRGTSLDVTRAHVPVSLRPLVLGVELTEEAHSRLGTTRDHDLSLAFSDASSGFALGDVRLRSTERIPTHGAELHLFEPRGCRNGCVAAPVRWYRYALAWRHARDAPARGDRLCMSASDLRALNVYYDAPRPVYAVSATDSGRTNVFPMDLVGALPSGVFSLALRSTSPAVELIEQSGRVATSGAPTGLLADIYALGAHHRESSINVDALPFRTLPSPRFSLPVIAGATIVRELTVRAVHRIGSHTLFICDIAHQAGEPHGMIAHTSAMHVEWLRRQGRTIEVLRR